MTSDLNELGALHALAYNADGESYRDMWLSSKANVARVAARANSYRVILKRLEPILRNYSDFLLTYDFDMHPESPDESLEAEADNIRAALAPAQ